MTMNIVASRKPKHRRRAYSTTEIHIGVTGELIYPHMRLPKMAEPKTAPAPVQVVAVKR